MLDKEKLAILIEAPVFNGGNGRMIPPTEADFALKAASLYRSGLSQAAIGKMLNVGRMRVCKILGRMGVTKQVLG